MDNKASAEKIRLTGFRNTTHWVAVFTGLFFGLFVYYWRDSMPSLRYPTLVVSILFIAAVYSVTIRSIENYFKWERGFYLLNFGWIPLYIGIVYGTGGAKSPFLIALLFPVITTSFNLNPAVTRRVAFFMFSAAVLMLFADPLYLKSGGFVAEYFIRFSILGIAMFYIYRLLKETLLQKYEKEEAKKKFDELLEVDKLKTDFVMVVSHQLRTPLTGARWGLSAILDRDDITPEAKRVVEQAQKRVDDSIHIVNEIVGSIDNVGSETGAPGALLDVSGVMEEAADKLKYLIGKNKVDFNFELPGQCMTEGNRDMLLAAFLNILDNAVRYSPGGKVSATMACLEDKIVVTISDNGIGVAPEDQLHVFKRFYRAKNALQVEPNGSGIGLYISKRIIEQHNGSISFTSTLGQGTKVVVELPRKMT